MPTDIDQIHIHWSVDESCEAYGDGHYGHVIEMHLRDGGSCSLVITRWVAGAVGQGMCNVWADWWAVFSLLVAVMAIVPVIIVAVSSEVVRILMTGATVAIHYRGWFKVGRFQLFFVGMER